MSNSGRIRRVNFRTHACQIVDLLAKSFDETLLIEGISFERNRKLAEKQSLLWLLDVFHPMLARFGEVFVWETQRRIVGTGAIIRVDLSDANTWILINFAFSGMQVSKFGVVSRMRTLLRMALCHAVKHGATRIQAYVRSDNSPVIRLCLAEGFLEVEQRFYWLLNNSQIMQIKKTEKEFLALRWTRQIFSLRYLPIQWLLSYLRGAKKELFSVYRGTLLLGNVEVLIPSILDSPCRISINFSENVPTKYRQSLIAQAISILPQNTITTPSVILFLSFSSGSDIWFPWELDCPVPRMKKKLLSLDIFH